MPLICIFRIPSIIRGDSDVVQAAGNGEGKPVIRVVSLKADNTNRGHAFDMDLCELQKDGKPLPYEEAQAYFQSDPSQR